MAMFTQYSEVRPPVLPWIFRIINSALPSFPTNPKCIDEAPPLEQLLARKIVSITKHYAPGEEGEALRDTLAYITTVKADLKSIQSKLTVAYRNRMP